MTNEPRTTKNARREAAREAARVAREQQKRRETRTKILVRGGVTLAIVLVAALIGISIWGATRGGEAATTAGPANMISEGIVLTGSNGEITAVSTPALQPGEDPVPTDDATLDAPLHIVTYVDYFCPVCNAFEQTNGHAIEALVSAGQASLEVHPVAILNRNSQGTNYSTRSGNAMACVAQYAPDKFLDAQGVLFANQPAEGTSGLTDGQLVDLVQGAVGDNPNIATCIRGNTFGGFIDAATQRAVNDPALVNPSSGGFGTPTVLVNGDRYNGAVNDPAAFSTFLQEHMPAN
ncbi:MAG: thioredoxin domain-containing protein [Actinomycetales bacterium]|nr:thioredoxin domain-containing protein [Actinomycetales bacterium]